MLIEPIELQQHLIGKVCNANLFVYPPDYCAIDSWPTWSFIQILCPIHHRCRLAVVVSVGAIRKPLQLVGVGV